MDTACCSFIKECDEKVVLFCASCNIDLCSSHISSHISQSSSKHIIKFYITKNLESLKTTQDCLSALENMTYEKINNLVEVLVKTSSTLIDTANAETRKLEKFLYYVTKSKEALNNCYDINFKDENKEIYEFISNIIKNQWLDMDQGVFDQAENTKSRIENAENLIRGQSFYGEDNNFKSTFNVYDTTEIPQFLEKIEKLENEKDFLNIQYEETTKRCHDFASQIEKLKREIDEIALSKDKKIKTLENELERKTEIIDYLKAKIDDKKRKLSIKETQVSSIQNFQEFSKQFLDRIASEKDDIENKLKTVTAEKMMLQERFDEMQEESNEEIKDLKDKIIMLENEIKNVIKNCMSNVEQLEIEKMNLELVVDKMKTEIGLLNDTIEALKGQPSQHTESFDLRNPRFSISPLEFQEEISRNTIQLDSSLEISSVESPYAAIMGLTQENTKLKSSLEKEKVINFELSQKLLKLTSNQVQNTKETDNKKWNFDQYIKKSKSIQELALNQMQQKIDYTIQENEQLEEEIIFLRKKIKELEIEKQVSIGDIIKAREILSNIETEDSDESSKIIHKSRTFNFSVYNNPNKGLEEKLTKQIEEAHKIIINLKNSEDEIKKLRTDYEAASSIIEQLQMEKENLANKMIKIKTEDKEISQLIVNLKVENNNLKVENCFIYNQVIMKLKASDNLLKIDFEPLSLISGFKSIPFEKFSCELNYKSYFETFDERFIGEVDDYLYLADKKTMTKKASYFLGHNRFSGFFVSPNEKSVLLYNKNEINLLEVTNESINLKICFTIGKIQLAKCLFTKNSMFMVAFDNEKNSYVWSTSDGNLIKILQKKCGFAIESVFGRLPDLL
ncbi:hypothetical protein SteCoe_27384 [Stentor coeruleus]|uniref:Uncharacterized protein n=1 Tax=Stentor coeruleus TaxID=5963 RepID=A0A1R2BAP7_9CILI|nr:hypothetical protein SteCoe_27384 [Stentor coeruleus]